MGLKNNFLYLLNILCKERVKKAKIIQIDTCNFTYKYLNLSLSLVVKWYPCPLRLCTASLPHFFAFFLLITMVQYILHICKSRVEESNDAGADVHRQVSHLAQMCAEIAAECRLKPNLPLCHVNDVTAKSRGCGRAVTEPLSKKGTQKFYFCFSSAKQHTRFDIVPLPSVFWMDIPCVSAYISTLDGT